MANDELDLDSLSLEELARLANGEELQPAGDHPRDDRGRFASSKEGQATSEEEHGQDEPDEIVYRRVIDLHDGSGVQVFEGANPEELIEKLAKAQENATRKIRELTTQKTVETTPQLDEDDEFVLSQQFLQSPTKAFRELFKRTTGKTVEEFKAESERVGQITQAQAGFNAGQEFQQVQPDYFPTPKNAVKIEKWLKVNSLDVSVENIGKAFEDLSESGLLETRPQSNDAAGNVQGTRIANPVGTVRRAASGVSSRRSAPVVVTQPTEEDLYNMPLAELERLASRS